MLALWLSAAFCLNAHAVQVELQLVVHDQPTVTVDKREHKNVITSPQSTNKGIEMRVLGTDLECWSRNVLLDGKTIFERYHDGKYIDRLPIARADLQQGDHTIWPGNHVFTIAKDGTITAKSKELIVEGSVVKIKCYPVTLKAYRANPEESGLPQAMRTAPLPTLTIRESGNEEAANPQAPKDPKKPKEQPKVLDLLPEFGKFAPLCIWLPGNSDGKGYLVHPLGFTFHISGEGIKNSAEAGKEIPGLQLTPFAVEIPLYGFPVRAPKGSSLVVTNVEQLAWHSESEVNTTNWFPLTVPYELKVSEKSAALKINGDPRIRPFKNFRIDNPNPLKPGQRLFAAEFEGRHFENGGSIKVALQCVDGRSEGDAGLIDLEKNAKISARIKAYGSDTWSDLPIQSVASELTLKLPDTADGLYELQIGAKIDENEKPITIERWISIAKNKSAGVGLFTRRGRTVFQRGENFWIGLGVAGLKETLPSGTPLELELIDAAGTRIPVLKQQTSAAVSNLETYLIRFESEQSLALAPGWYTVHAKLGTLVPRPIKIQVVETEPATHFTNMMMGKYSSEGANYASVLQSGAGAEELARSIANMGHNSFQGMSYNLNRIARTSLEVEQVARERAELGPWESFYQPSTRDRFMEASVRNGLRFYEDMMTYNDTMMPRDPQILGAISRYTSLETMSMRYSPSFKGVCLYDEVYNAADTGKPMSAHFLAAEEMTYREQNPGMSSADALRALERYTSRPYGQRKVEDLNKFKTWPAHEDKEWATFSKLMAESAKTVMPDSQNFTMQRFWGANGGNIAPNGTSNDVFAPLDAAACVMYKDGGAGDRPVFAPMQADVMRVRDDLPVWTQLHTFHASGIYGSHLLRQAFFALSQKIDGFTYFSLESDNTNPSYYDNRDDMNDIAHKICTQYGDLFLSLKRGYKKVAIYYSREADYLESKKPINLSMACEGLWVACMRAGFPADFIYDHQIRAGKGQEYDVIFAPGFYYEDETPTDILTALQKLAHSGKSVVIERASKLPVDGALRIDSDLDEYDDKMGSAFPRYIDFESDMVWNQSEETTKIVRSFLSKIIPPAAEHNLLTGPDWLRGGQGEFLVVPNFAYTGFSYLHKTLFQAPSRPTLRFPKRPPVCYDMLEMKRVDVKSNGDWMTLQADFRECPGKIFAFLPDEIASVELKLPAQAAANSMISYEIRVLGKQGTQIDSPFPVEIEILDNAGVSQQKFYRSASPVYTGAYRIPINLPAGNLTFKIRELISGTTTETKVALSPGSNPEAKTVLSEVLIGDLAQLKTFITVKSPIIIALDEEQSWCKSEAERLAAELKKMGRDVKIAPSSKIIRLPGEWNDKSVFVDGTRLWRGDVVEPGLFVDSSLIVLGKRYDNRLIEAMIQRDLFSDRISENFPGKNRALLGCSHQAFSNQFDTVTIFSQDIEGLRKGIDAFLSIEKQQETWPARPTVAHATAAQPSTGSPQRSTKTEPAHFVEQISNTDRVQAMDVDPKSGRIVVGTYGYNNNLFCFAADGKLQWKQFLPEHNVYQVQWFDDGKRMLAASAIGNYFFLIDPATGKVLKKFRTSEWPNYHYGEGPEETYAQIIVNSALKQILIRGLTGILAIDYEGKKLWNFDRAEAIASYPEDAEQLLAASFGHSAEPGNMGLSADGKRIIYSETRLVGTTVVMNELHDMWGHRPMLINAESGEVITENKEDKGSSTGAGGWWCAFPEGSEEPELHQNGYFRTLKADGTLGTPTPETPGQALKDGSRILTSISGVTRVKGGVELWNIHDSEFWITGMDIFNREKTRLYRCAWNGLIRCFNTDDGKTLWEHKLPVCAKLKCLDEADVLLVGAKNGTVLKFDAKGAVLWQLRVREHNQIENVDYPAFIKETLARDRDASAEFFSVQTDRPGEYENVIRLGIEQLTNGDFENADGWQVEAGAPVFKVSGHSFAIPGVDEGRALALPIGQLTTQALNRRIIPNATYLLEFMYRAENPGTKLIAGALLKGSKETLTASKFSGKAGEWAFGRLAFKTYEDTNGLSIGFEAEGGPILVDKASLKAVRFPSANLLANSELHQVEPTYVKDIRVRYNKIPSTLRDKLMSKNHVTAYKQGQSVTAQAFTQEQAYLHNGRIDDVGPMWTYAPDNMGYSVTLTKPAYVSHVVLYLNNSTPDNLYSMISIVANVMEAVDPSTPQKKSKVQGMPKLVALVRGNQKRFVIVNFPKPIFTDSIKVLPGKHPGKQECVTEIELYGPLGGDGSARTASTDPLEAPMFMSTPSHTAQALPGDLIGEYQNLQNIRGAGPAFNAGITTFNGMFAFAEPSGAIVSVKIPGSNPRDPAPKGKPSPALDRAEDGLAWPLASVTPLGTPAHYSGRLLTGSADYKMHAVADNGAYLWSFATGGRIYSSPLPNGDDLYFGSDDGKLYNIDVDSGTLIWEYKTGGKIRGAPALADGRVIVPSGDGFVYALAADGGTLIWKTPIAKNTRASAALKDSKVFLGDESGKVYTLDGASGKVLWQKQLKGYVSQGPVVTQDGVFFASEQGEIALFSLDGSQKWSRALNVRLTGQTIATESQLILPSENGLLVLKRSDGTVDERFKAPNSTANVMGVQVYRNRICLSTAQAVTDFKVPPRTYANYSGGPAIWVPKPAAEGAK